MSSHLWKGKNKDLVILPKTTLAHSNYLLLSVIVDDKDGNAVKLEKLGTMFLSESAFVLQSANMPLIARNAVQNCENLLISCRYLHENWCLFSFFSHAESYIAA